ncbi:MAG TPA: GNAT family N-acetyltransferase [Sphingomonas sp.]|nr:GNAT family N-acetyltransferase [Sphingomonas sp.]
MTYQPGRSAFLITASPRVSTAWTAGLPDAIDRVADAGPAHRRFLRRAWFAAAVAAYGGSPRTLLVHEDDTPVAALPIVALGPKALGLAQVPGSYWPLRSAPIAQGASDAAIAAMVVALAGDVRALRLGPVQDDDPAALRLIAAARANGWTVIDRWVAPTSVLDIGAQRAAGTWPRPTTARKNRFHEKHLAAHGVLDWRFLHDADWPTAFAALGAIEGQAWVATRTDGRDAKFTARGHLAFWRAAAGDPVLAGMFTRSLVSVAEEPAAFTFQMDVGATRYAIATAYVPAYAKHSPGKLLYWRDLAVAADRGIARVDWGAGDSGYKAVIGADPGPALRDWLFLRPGLTAAAGRALAGVWRRSGPMPS